MWHWQEDPEDNTARADPPPAPWRWGEESRHPRLYAVLQLAPEASQEEIRRSFRRLAHGVHPDLRPSAEQPAAMHEMAELNAAYHTLSDPARRAAYDREHGLD